MNLIILCGNLTNDPEASQTSGGREVSKFSIAVNREYEDSEGNRGSRHPDESGEGGGRPYEPPV